MNGIFFCPYFGKLPRHFQLWLNSCSYNPNFTFYIFTDDMSEYLIPQNVKIINCSFDDMRKHIQSRFDFPIQLEKPYKLCDYKPAYGYIFKDLLQGYDYWGYCDLDLIFGNLMKFMPEKTYDKISHLSHVCLLRNNQALINAFMKTKSKITYKDIFSSNVHFAFDEVGSYGINKIFRENGFTIYPLELYCADVNCLHNNMLIYKKDPSGEKRKKLIVNRDHLIFSFDKGNVVGWNIEKGQMVQKEYAYVHFQKRRMSLNCDAGNTFIICPHSFEQFQIIDNDVVKRYQVSRIYLEPLKIKRDSINRAITRMIAERKIIKSKQ